MFNEDATGPVVLADAAAKVPGLLFVQGALESRRPTKQDAGSTGKVLAWRS